MLNIVSLLISVVCVFIVITVFGFTKALVSYFLGDSFPKESGMLTLNPIKHFEPIGYLLFLFFGYGWGKPIENRPINFKSGKYGVIIANAIPIIISAIISLVLKVIVNFFVTPFVLNSDIMGYIYVSLSTLSVMFMKMAVFNLIPIYPLYGSYILKSYMNTNTLFNYLQKEKVFQMVFMLLIVFGIANHILDFVVNLLMGW